MNQIVTGKVTWYRKFIFEPNLSFLFRRFLNRKEKTADEKQMTGTRGTKTGQVSLIIHQKVCQQC